MEFASDFNALIAEQQLISKQSSVSTQPPVERAESSLGTSTPTSIEQLLSTSPEIYRASVRSICPATNPEDWAAAQLALGAVLRAQSWRERGNTRLFMCRQAAAAFEAAASVYSSNLPVLKSASDDAGSSSNKDGIDLVLEATQQPFLQGSEELEGALNLFKLDCSTHAQAADVRQWLVSMINVGCALVLLGKIAAAAGDTSRLEEAIDTFRAVLSQSALYEFPNEYYATYINLSEAFRSLSEVAMGEESWRYMESCLSALTKALLRVVPQQYRSLIDHDPIVPA